MSPADGPLTPRSTNAGFGLAVASVSLMVRPLSWALAVPARATASATAQADRVFFMGSSLWGGLRVREQLAVVERLGCDDGIAGRVEPGRARAVVAELDAVAVGVVQVDGEGREVLGPVVDLVAVVQQALDGLGQLAPVGVQERDVIEAAVPGGRRLAAGALQRVE